jgi:hypothetical protein
VPRKLLSLIVVLLPLRVGALQVQVPSKSALERRGLHHANIRGRFISEAGEPVPRVHVQMNAGRPRALPLVDVVSDADGNFEVHDVNSEYMPDLRWYPPERWLSGARAILSESGDNIDAGTIALQPNTVIRVEVEVVGGPPIEDRDRRPNIILQGPNQFQRIVAESAGNLQVLRQITFDRRNTAGFSICEIADRNPSAFRCGSSVDGGINS